MITVPFMRFIVNTAETNIIVNSSQKGNNRPSTVLFYRCADGELACVHWEICENIIDGHYIGRYFCVSKYEVANQPAFDLCSIYLLNAWTVVLCGA